MKDNQCFFTPIQTQRANAARDLYEMKGFPSLKDYKGTVQYGMLWKIKIDSKDISNTIIIFVKNLDAIQWKNTNRAPSSARFDYIDIPEDFLRVHYIYSPNR